MSRTQPRIQVTNPMVGICHMQVCAVREATDEEILAVCNRENPSGTTHGWCTVHRVASDDSIPTPGAITCADDTGRLHILVSC